MFPANEPDANKANEIIKVEIEASPVNFAFESPIVLLGIILILTNNGKNKILQWEFKRD